MGKTHEQETDEQLRGLLIALYAHGPTAIVSSAATAGRERRTARRALRLGCAELVEHGRLPRDIHEAGLRMIRLADLGRAVLGLPEPAPLGDRDPVDVLKAAVRLFMGANAFPVIPCSDGSTDPRMIASADHAVVDGWPTELDAVTRFAAEQGVASCETVSEHIRGDEWHLTGFAAGEVTTPPDPVTTHVLPTPEADSQPGLWATDLAYLQDELQWVEARCVRIARERRRDRGPKDLASRRTGFLLDEEEIEPGTIDEARAREDDLRTDIDARLARHRAVGPEIALDRLVRLHGLDEFERDVLLLACGPCVSRRYEKLYSKLEGERQPALTVDVAFSFFELDTTARVTRRAFLGPQGALLVNDLIEANYGGRTPSPKDLLGVEIELRARTFSFVLGDESLGDELASLASVEKPRATFERVVLPAEDKRRILAVVEGRDQAVATLTSWGLDDVITYGRGCTLLFHGAPGTGKTLTAHAVAHRLGKRVLSVDLPTFTAHQEAGRFMPALFREARLQNAILFFDECESLFASRRHGNELLTVLLTEIERFAGIAILATNLPHLLDDALDRRVLVRVHFAIPEREAREAIWRSLLPPGVPLAPDVDLTALAERHVMSGGHVKNAVLVAAMRAIHEASALGRALITHAMLDEAARDQSTGRRVTAADADRLDRQEFESRAAPTRRRAGFGAGEP